jgi:hypothetical protein
MADYCSLDDAFPASMSASPGCRGTSAPVAQSRSEAKKAKKCKGPQAAYLTDPDRPSLASAGVDGQLLRGSTATNPYDAATGLFEHQPVGAPGILGAADGASVRLPNGQTLDDYPVAAPLSAYAERKPPPSNAVNTMLRETEGPAQLKPSKTPAYFGAGLDEDEGFIGFGGNNNVVAKDDGFANYVPSTAGNKDDYMLSPDFSKTFGAHKVDRAAGMALPIPSLVDAWKKITPSGAASSFIETLPAPGGEYIIGTSQAPDFRNKMDQIFARLDDLENDRSGSENNQMEIFLFILSGMFVMFAVDSFSRR